MSVSAAAPRRVLARRRPLPYILLAMLGALALCAVVVALTVSNGSSTSGRATAKSAGVGSSPGAVALGAFRDPSTHALLAQPVSTPVQSTSIRSTPGPGHK